MPVWLLVKSACLASSAACFYQPVPRSGSWHFCHYFLGLICALTQCRLSPRLLSSPVSSSWNSSPVNPSVCINSPFSFPWPYSLVAIPLWLIPLASPQVPQFKDPISPLREKLLVYCSDYWFTTTWRPRVFLPGEFHGQRRLVGYCSWNHKELGTTEQLTLNFRNRNKNISF